MVELQEQNPDIFCDEDYLKREFSGVNGKDELPEELKGRFTSSFRDEELSDDFAVTYVGCSTCPVVNSSISMTDSHLKLIFRELRTNPGLFDIIERENVVIGEGIIGKIAACAVCFECPVQLMRAGKYISGKTSSTQID